MADFPPPRVFGYSYDSPARQVEYKVFNDQYYTGADTRIYFGDIWLDEITGIQFSMQENVAPIFGYASYTWDKVARGSRQIQGQFSINFKESYYLIGALNQLQNKYNTNGTTTGFSYDAFKGNTTLEQLTTQVGNSNFYAIADNFEKTFWSDEGRDSQKQNKAIRENNSYFTNDIPGAQGGQKELGEHGFSIIMTYGPYHAQDGASVAGTAVTLTGVQITGVSQVVGRDGSPVEEVYTFIARDLNSDVRK